MLRPGGRPERRPGHAAHLAGQEIALLPRRQKVGGAEELGGKAIVRAVEYRLRRAQLFDPPRVHHHDAVAQLHGLFLVVGHADHGGAALAQYGPHLGAQLFAKAAVQAGKRLVHEDQVGLRGQGPGQRNALLLSAGELVRIPSVVSFQVNHPQRRRHLLLAMPRAAEPEGDVLRDGQVGEQGAFLEHHADAALLRALVHARPVHGAPADLYGSGVGRVKPGDQAQGGGFAAATGAQQAEDLARFNVKVDVGDGLRFPKGFPQARQPQGLVLGNRFADCCLRVVIRLGEGHFQAISRRKMKAD